MAPQFFHNKCIDRGSRLLVLSILLASACRYPSPGRLLECAGSTMGTTYKVLYLDSLDREFQRPVDSLLVSLNLSLSTYIDTSTISRINQSTATIHPMDDHFEKVYRKAKFIYRQTKGAFDPTVMPLVNYWGFGYKGEAPEAIDTVAIDSLLELVGFDQFHTVTDRTAQAGKTVLVRKLLKQRPGSELDFSAIAKGYGVDAVAAFLESRQIRNYLVEIGGEVRTRGKDEIGKTWRIGINKPEEGASIHALHAVIGLENASMATSGNYRNFIVRDGRKFVHTINPKTGYPEESKLLSASIIAPDCMTADAFATACMVLGMPGARQLVEDQEEVEGYFITSDEAGNLLPEYTDGFKRLIIREQQD